jgi:hypothetical protein
LAKRLTYLIIGLVLGALGLGWHGRPPDAVIVEAIRARSPEHAQATITLHDVTRNWFHEIYSSSTSQFLVTATVAPRDGPAVDRCFGIEPGLAGTAIALGPYAAWRCDYPF